MRAPGDLYEPQERTIVDAGRQWIECYASKRPALAAVLADEYVRKRAKRTVRSWREACEWRVSQLRRTKAIRKQVRAVLRRGARCCRRRGAARMADDGTPSAQMSMSHVHRIGTELMRALITQHETFATFLSEPLDGLQRWQMFMILVTVVCSQLLVNIWMCAR